MNKYLIILLLTFFPASSFANYFSSLERAKDSCRAIYSNVLDIGFWRCHADAYKSFRESTRLNSLRSYANNVAFIYEQLGYITQDAANGKISREEYKSKGSYLLQVREDIGREAIEATRRELNDITEQDAAQQSLLFFERVVRSLSGQVRASDSNSAIYIINGRIISCRKFGAIINCN
jgi:hypothetical protein